MNVERFREEFTELFRRSTTDSDKNSLPSSTPLTNQEILDVVHEVLSIKLDESLIVSTRNDVTTPAAAIVITTPDAPDIPKILVEHNGSLSGRFRSLDTLTSESLKNSPVEDLMLPEPGQLKSKVEENNNDAIALDVADGNVDNKKEMSKSSPSMSTLVRSGTFTREDEFKSVENGDVFEEKNIPVPVATNGTGIENTMAGMSLSEIAKKLSILRDSAADVVNKIDSFEKNVPERSRPEGRRLTSMGCFPGLNRTLTTQRSKLARRSLAAFPDTPTSSRLSPEVGENKNSLRRKSTSAASLVNVGTSKLSIPPANRSVSSGAIAVSNKSPTPRQGSQTVRTKPPKTPVVPSSSLSLWNDEVKTTIRQNPKYAHIQSTIPKPGVTLGKRKAN